MLGQMKFGRTLRKTLRLIRNADYQYMHRERFDLAQYVAKSNIPERFRDAQPSNDALLKQMV